AGPAGAAHGGADGGGADRLPGAPPPSRAGAVVGGRAAAGGGHPLRPATPPGAAGGGAAAEPPLSETGWTASSNTSSSAGDAPANAIDGNTSTRFSSDADQASGMYFQVNLGSAQAFNQIEMNAGGSTGDYARGYNVEVSSNGTSFTSVATGT